MLSLITYDAHVLSGALAGGFLRHWCLAQHLQAGSCLSLSEPTHLRDRLQLLSPRPRLATFPFVDGLTAHPQQRAKVGR